MNHDMTNWQQELQKHALRCRATRPISGRDSLTWPQMQQMLIIKGSLLPWIKNLTPAASSAFGSHEDRRLCFVFTSNSPGLVAANEISEEQNPPLVLFYPEEFNVFLQQFPDKDQIYHAHIWSHFLECAGEELQKTGNFFPQNDKERYWIHVEGIIRGSQLGRGMEHLWSWDGRQAKLLRKNFRHWSA